MKINGKKFTFVTLGCRVNLFESSSIIETMRKKGGIYVEHLEDAQIIVINTCAVTNKASSKSAYFVNKACRSPVSEFVVVCGCSSQHTPKQFQDEKVKILIGSKFKSRIPELIEKCDGQQIVMVDNLMCEEEFETFEQYEYSVNTRAYIKIQDGCDFFCSYCLIPFVRGKQRSLSDEIVVKTIENFRDHGFKEIVLTGVNTSGYHYKDVDFLSLLKKVNEISGDFRIRVSSLEPFQINYKIIDLITENKSRFCQFFHLCLQSANNEILKSMNRKYTIQEFEDLVAYIRKKSPDASICTDYIVGYPTETEEIFNSSLEELEKISFSDMHIFQYSKRDQTPAAHLKSLVSDTVKKQRYKIVEKLCEK
jgi:threonylcarbamoyladenosine tRNA methylthiotransferase MtaB